MTIDFTDDEFVSVYDNCPLWSAQFVNTVLDKLVFIEDAVVLDIGTGTGVPALEIAERMGKKSIIYAIDHWSTALKRAELKATHLGVKNVVFKNASALDTTFQDDYFDYVISNNCLNNIDDYDVALNECYRVLKPGGRIIQIFNLPESLQEFYDVFKTLLVEKGMSLEVEALYNHIHQKRKSTENTIKATEQVGFKVVDISEHCFPWRFNNGTSLLNYSFVQMAWLPSWHQIVSETQRDAFFSELEKRLNIYAGENNGLNLKIPYACVVAKKEKML
ncbi:MAG: class I SAM-dependent methyltransferase [Oscillospiraceae bacterium]|jgi:ubiquinone/menaquinone biosynthesis C-methylase UbiE|nr:class I SAM-dependent methyltransferase [Oscillospiraceae bacterium]